MVGDEESCNEKLLDDPHLHLKTTVETYCILNIKWYDLRGLNPRYQYALNAFSIQIHFHFHCYDCSKSSHCRSLRKWQRKYSNS